MNELNHSRAECDSSNCRIHGRGLPPINTLPDKITGLECPFCGSTDLRAVEQVEYVGCASCGAETFPSHCRQQPGAQRCELLETRQKIAERNREEEDARRKELYSNGLVDAIVRSPSAMKKLARAVESAKGLI
jgi:hypothetical protein